MACCILISLYLLNELSYDKFHQNTRVIYGAVNDQSFEGNTWHISATPALLAPALKQEFPEVTASTRYVSNYQTLINTNDKTFFENRIYCVDPDFLEMFSFPLIFGDSNTALQNTFSIILTEKIAEKYFPEGNPLGKTMLINTDDSFIVTGVIKDPPNNSTLKFEMLIPFKYREEQYKKEGRSFSWRSNNPRTFIMLQNQNAAERVNEKIKNFVREKANEEDAPEFSIVALGDFRFSPYYGGSGRAGFLSILSVIALFLLIMACVNYMNLSTARSASRAKEIGLRKVVGAVRRNVIFQFMGESIMLSFIALFLAVGLVFILLPAFNSIFNQNLPLNLLANFYVIPVLTRNI